MNGAAAQPGPSYEVSLAGTLGRAYSVTLASMGVGRIDATSTFLVPVSDAAGLRDLLARLAARGLVTLDVRRVPDDPA